MTYSTFDIHTQSSATKRVPKQVCKKKWKNKKSHTYRYKVIVCLGVKRKHGEHCELRGFADNEPTRVGVVWVIRWEVGRGDRSRGAPNLDIVVIITHWKGKNVKVTIVLFKAKLLCVEIGTSFVKISQNRIRLFIHICIYILYKHCSLGFTIFC